MNRPKISVYLATSLDGYIAREDGGLDWLDSIPTTPDEDYGFREFMDSVDVLVMGRNTYEVVSSFGEWPYHGKRVMIISRSLESVREEAELYSGEIEPLMEQLHDEGVRHVYVDGGITACKFFEKGFVDQLTITLIPTILGAGIRLFSPMKREQSCSLISSKSYPNGLVQLRYGFNTV